MQPLVHIGYHKTGTTWLQKRVFPNAKSGFSLVAGAKILLPAFVEVNPFGFDPEAVRARLGPGIREAQAQNLVPVLSLERLSGNPHSGGHDSQVMADRLAAVFPDARILLVIREQTSMLVSIYKQYIDRGGAASFRQYITVPPGAARVPLFNLDFLEYHHLIGYYQRLFGTDKVLVLPYELLETRPDAFLKRISTFLGAPVTGSKFKRANVSLSAFALSLKRQANRWVVRDSLNPAPPFEVPGANRALLRICKKVDAKVPTTLSERYEHRWREFAEREVGSRYAESNALTARLTGLDLRTFGYACK